MESLTAELKAAKRRYMDVQVPADDVEALNRKKTAVEQQVSEVTEQAKLWHEYRKLNSSPKFWCVWLCIRPFEGVDTHGLSEKLAQLQTELKEVAMPAVDDLNEMLEQKTKLIKKLEPMVHSDVERRINQTQEEIGRSPSFPVPPGKTLHCTNR